MAASSAFSCKQCHSSCSTKQLAALSHYRRRHTHATSWQRGPACRYRQLPSHLRQALTDTPSLLLQLLLLLGLLLLPRLDLGQDALLVFLLGLQPLNLLQT